MTNKEIESADAIECGNCPNELRRVRNKEVEACPRCGAEAYPIKDLPEPVDVELHNLRKDEEYLK